MFKRSIFVMALVVCVLAMVPIVAMASSFQMKLATTNLSSGSYPWAVGISETVNKYEPGVSCRTIALGGAGMTIPALKAGQANFATNITSWDIPNIVAGTGKWVKFGKTDIRLFSMREFGYLAWYVTKSSGVKNVMDLKGKKMNMGILGSAAEGQVKLIEDVLQIGVDWTRGSTGTAKQQIKDRQIIGYIKASPGFPPGSKYRARFDASAVDVSTSVPLTLVGFTEEQKNAIIAKHPNLKKFILKIPAGTVEQAQDLPDLWMPAMTISAMVVKSDVPQEVQYKIIKAMDEHWQDTVAAAYPPCKGWNPIKDTIEFAPDGVKLAPGVVQYAKEKGIAVPAELIPPEYKK
jgi:uncharacterized protein